MKVEVLGSTKMDYKIPEEEVIRLSGYMSGICYQQDDFRAVRDEPYEDTKKRVEKNIRDIHHSIVGHVNYNLVFEGVPKIIAMLLNNEHEYNTSERSARYTVMPVEGEEKETYEKWIEKFDAAIRKNCPRLVELEQIEIEKKKAQGKKPESVLIRKLAQENARYFISVFSPCTTLGYSSYYRQFCYMVRWLRNLAKRTDTDFYKQLSPYSSQVADLIESVTGRELDDGKNRGFTLFTDREVEKHFGDTYSISYKGTFSQLAQAQRHRSLFYNMIIPDWRTAEFFVPPVIRNDQELVDEYLADMKRLAHNYPQGMLVTINERGIPEKFVEKCYERRCGGVQWETCHQVYDIGDEYSEETKIEAVKALLEPVIKGAKCQILDYKCGRPCPYGPNHAYDRII